VDNHGDVLVFVDDLHGHETLARIGNVIGTGPRQD
jgi:hypothetical protein